MPRLDPNLILSRCPHCSVADPNVSKVNHFETRAHDSTNARLWYIYKCGRCGGVIAASARRPSEEVIDLIPRPLSINSDIPSPAHDYLVQAAESLHTPAGSIMLSASAVDSMLKIKEYHTGSLYTRINQAVEDHLITEEMSTWAHRVRLDANEQRHADLGTGLPTNTDANHSLEFALALAQFLFVLPAMINRGIEETDSETSE